MHAILRISFRWSGGGKWGLALGLSDGAMELDCEASQYGSNGISVVSSRTVVIVVSMAAIATFEDSEAFSMKMMEVMVGLI